ncbi:hypothetical protein HY571_02875 [Candidatus Micrarchaeota archaeon]|nr:hypothetical protein [Candidatus Micrarchaeota archaeon]
MIIMPLSVRKSSFIPFPDLLARPGTRVGSEVKALVGQHKLAVKAKASVGTAGHRNKADLNAAGHALLALREALQYYAKHGQVERAYTDIRRVARRYWHPSIHKAWAHNFAAQAADLGVDLPPALASKIAVQRRTYIEKILGRTELPAKGEYKKTV